MPNQQADVLLVTVTEIETKAVIDAVRDETGQEAVIETVGTKTYHDFGEVHGTRVWHVRSEPGAMGLGSAIQTVQKGIEALSPDAVVMVGIAFGIDEAKQRIGDVLVSKKLFAYEPQRVEGKDGDQRIIPRGSRVDCSPWLLDRCQTAALARSGVAIRFGTVLSGEKLVDDVEFRAQLMDMEPEAIGGEMEGAGLYAACHDAKVDWILIKGICDWADGEKSKNKKARQGIAAENAAAFALQVLKVAPLKLEDGNSDETPSGVARSLRRDETDGVVTTLRDTPVADFSPKHPAFYVPFRQKGDQVVGRADALAEVRRQLEEGRPTSIGQAAAFTGLGGLGKTQLAVEYAYTYRDEYPSGVVWITADQEIEPQLIEAAEKARWVSPQSDHKSKLDIALHRVRTFGGGLVVFDNVEDRADIEPYLPIDEAAPHLLLTGRSAITGFTPVPLSTLNPDDAYTMLVQEANRSPIGSDEEDAARAIVARLDGLPLAIELVGAYLRYRPAASYSGYLELFEEGVTKALSRADLDSFTKHNKDVAAALVLQDRLIEDAPSLPSVLTVLTWSASAAMSRGLLQALLPDVSKADVLGALDLGVSLRLFRRVPDTDRYAIHRLVAEVRREGDTPNAELMAKMARLLADWFKKRCVEFDQLDAYEANADHLSEWAMHVTNVDTALAAELTWLQCFPFFHRGQVDREIGLVEDARILFDASGSSDPELDAHLLHDLAVALDRKGEYEKALKMSERALAVRRSALGEDHLDTARSLASISATLGSLGEHEEALKMGERALAVRRSALGDDHPDTAHSLNSVGVSLHALGEYEEALMMKNEAQAMRRSALGDDHPDTASSLVSVGVTLHTLGHNKEAQDHLEAAVAYLDANRGESHPGTLHAIEQLALVYEKRGLAPRGLRLVEWRMKLADKSLPPYAGLRDIRDRLRRKVPGARQPKRRR